MFKYDIGETYVTQCGNLVKVLGRTALKGYECLVCDDNMHRYDRSVLGHERFVHGDDDAGRVTGTAHDYSYEHNFARVSDV